MDQEYQQLQDVITKLAEAQTARLEQVRAALDAAESRAKASEMVAARVKEVEAALEEQLAARKAAEEQVAKLRAEVSAQDEQLVSLGAQLERNNGHLTKLVETLDRVMLEMSEARKDEPARALSRPTPPPPTLPKEIAAPEPEVELPGPEIPVLEDLDKPEPVVPPPAPVSMAPARTRPKPKPDGEPIDLPFFHVYEPPARSRRKRLTWIIVLVVVIVAALGWAFSKRLLLEYTALTQPDSSKPSELAGGDALELDLAKEAFNRGEYVRSESIYRDLLKTHPDSQQALRGLAQALLRQNRVEESAAILQRLDPNKK